MKEKRSKPVYIGDEIGKPIPAWWLGCCTLITFTLCIFGGIWFILVYLP